MQSESSCRKRKDVRRSKATEEKLSGVTEHGLKKLVMAQGLFDKSCSAVRNAHWGTSPTRDMRMRGKVIVLTVRHRGLVTYCRTIG